MGRIVSFLMVVAYGLYVYNGATVCVQMQRLILPIHIAGVLLNSVGTLVSAEWNPNFLSTLDSVLAKFVMEVVGGIGAQC